MSFLPLTFLKKIPFQKTNYNPCATLLFRLFEPSCDTPKPLPHFDEKSNNTRTKNTHKFSLNRNVQIMQPGLLDDVDDDDEFGLLNPFNPKVKAQ